MADYIPNDEAAIIADELIETYHPHLTGVKIAHLTRLMAVPKKPKIQKPGRKVVLAKASKITPKMAALASDNFKFIIEYGSLYWDKMTPEQHRAIVDHELGHCGNDADGPYMKSHDVEDFGYMIERYGCWKSDVEAFVKTVLEKFTTPDSDTGESVITQAAEGQ